MSQSKRAIKKIQPVLDRILSLEETMRALSDAALRNQTYGFRRRLAEGETEDSILPEAYAVVREAARRVLHMEHYPSQIIGGIVLHQGRIAEMRTGEGKTLVATLPAYLNALQGKGVHIVTTNDYLAGRDAEQMGKVHAFLGLSVGTVLGGMKPAARKAAYDCDITYVTNSELGFDYLRDNMATSRSQMVQRGFHYCIIDEADSVLIDDAGTPLIISGEGTRPAQLYGACDVLARRMVRGDEPPELGKIDLIAGVEAEETGDYFVMEKEKRVVMTAAGIRRTERYFRIDNLADGSNLEIRHNMDLALRANAILQRDKDYVVSNGEVLIVDGLTGRTMPGRRYSDGLHQAIEAKEHVHIHEENRTAARITYQSFFNKYEKLSGMTGTGRSREQEFIDVYGMDIVEIPTNRPVQRIDREDVFFPSHKAKLDAVCQKVLHCTVTGQPVLVGTVTVADSEELSNLFSSHGIRHSVLNAKHHDREAAIVSQAGRKGAVTIATSMAGRGTDIKLDQAAREAGGLLVIGTERYDSVRTDDQLRGRSGRQGDPGESIFYLSIEDGLLRNYPKARLEKAYDAAQDDETASVHSAALIRMVKNAQCAMEAEQYAARRKMIEFDSVLNTQREVIYARRREVLESRDVRGMLQKLFSLLAEDALAETVGISSPEERMSAAAHYFDGILSIPAIRALSACTEQDFPDRAAEELDARLCAIEASFPDAKFLCERERSLLLATVDSHWADHMERMELLRDGIGLVGYAQQKPIVEYAKSAYELFSRMNRDIRHATAATLLHAADLN